MSEVPMYTLRVYEFASAVVTSLHAAAPWGMTAETHFPRAGEL